jgi:mono/diheme cytochrome c family protein
LRRTLLKLRWIAALVLLAALGLLFVVLSRPEPLTAADLPRHKADPERGRLLYIIGGCISCHRPAEEDKTREVDLPSGGRPLKTPVGTLYPPNITPDPATGIGRWSALDFVNAVSRGISPDGTHYVPAFPYTSYDRMPLEDVLDLHAYAASIPSVAAVNHDPVPPWIAVLRRGIGLWKRLAVREPLFTSDPGKSDSWNLGAYLVNAPGHCGECHTPRNLLMLPDRGRHLAGGPHPEGKGRVPSLRNLVGRGRYADADELTDAMRFGEMMGYDRLSSGGMGEVQANLAKLPEAHVRAIAEYLVSLK